MNRRKWPCAPILSLGKPTPKSPTSASRLHDWHCLTDKLPSLPQVKTGQLVCSTQMRRCCLCTQADMNNGTTWLTATHHSNLHQPQSWGTVFDHVVCPFCKILANVFAVSLVIRVTSAAPPVLSAHTIARRGMHNPNRTPLPVF